MLLTAERMTELGKLLDAARTDPARRCGTQLQTEDGETYRLEPKPLAKGARLERKVGAENVEYVEGVAHVRVPLGTCGVMALGIDPETGEVACTLHGKEGR